MPSNVDLLWPCAPKLPSVEHPLLRSALALLHAGRPLDAIEACNAFLAGASPNINVLVIRGRAYEAADHPTRALEDMRFVALLDPHNAEALGTIERIQRLGEAARDRSMLDLVDAIVDCRIAPEGLGPQQTAEAPPSWRDVASQGIAKTSLERKQSLDSIGDSTAALSEAFGAPAMAYSQKCHVVAASPPVQTQPPQANGSRQKTVAVKDAKTKHKRSRSPTRKDAGVKSYPSRSGAPACQYWLKTGKCNYGSRCKFDHPPRDESLVNALNRRDCFDYVQTGTCPYGKTCKYNHPPRTEPLATTTKKPQSETVEEPPVPAPQAPSPLWSPVVGTHLAGGDSWPSSVSEVSGWSTDSEVNHSDGYESAGGILSEKWSPGLIC